MKPYGLPSTKKLYIPNGVKMRLRITENNVFIWKCTIECPALSPPHRSPAILIQFFLLHQLMINCTSVELPRHSCRSHSQRLTIYKGDSLVSNEYTGVLWEIIQYSFSRCLFTSAFWSYSSL